MRNDGELVAAVLQGETETFGSIGAFQYRACVREPKEARGGTKLLPETA